MQHFQLNDEQDQIRDTVAKLAAESIEPVALEHDEHRTFVQGSLDALGELGLFGMAVSEEAGGAGFGMLSLVVATEELAKVCGSSARLLQIEAGACAKALEGLETGAELLGQIAMGEALVGFVGPDAGVVATEGGSLDGLAPLVTGGAKASSFLVAARTADGESVLASVGADQCQVDEVLSLGFRATAPAKVALTGVSATVLAHGADADAAIERALVAAWIGGGALAVGTGLASIEASRRHTAERIAFGKPLQKQQAVAHKLVESARRVDAARHQVWHAARLLDGEADGVRDAALRARLTACEAVIEAADEAIQVHGGYGFTVEYHVERHYRDTQTLATLEYGADWMKDQLAVAVLS